MGWCLCLVSQPGSPGFGLSQALRMDTHWHMLARAVPSLIVTSPATNTKGENQRSSLREDGLECCTVHLTFLLHPSFPSFIPAVSTRKLALVSTLSCCLEFPFCGYFSCERHSTPQCPEGGKLSIRIALRFPWFPQSKEFEESWDYRALFVRGLKACGQVDACEAEGELPVTDERWQWNSVLHREQPVRFVTLQDKAPGDNAQRGTEAAAFSQAF